MGGFTPQDKLKRSTGNNSDTTDILRPDVHSRDQTGSRYAIPATATGGLLVLALSPTVVDAKVEVTKPIDVAPIKKASKYSAVDTIIFFLRQLLFINSIISLFI